MLAPVSCGQDINTKQVTMFSAVWTVVAPPCRQHLEATLHREQADTSERDALIAADAAAAEARRSADAGRRAAERAALQLQATTGQLAQIGEHASCRCQPAGSIRRCLSAYCGLAVFTVLQPRGHAAAVRKLPMF